MTHGETSWQRLYSPTNPCASQLHASLSIDGCTPREIEATCWWISPSTSDAQAAGTSTPTINDENLGFVEGFFVAFFAVPMVVVPRTKSSASTCAEELGAFAAFSSCAE